MRSPLDTKSLIFGTKGDSLKVMCVAPPRLYGLLKLHKDNQPIRPVVAFYSHPSFKVAGFLAEWFTLISEFSPKHKIKNSIIFANELSKLQFSHDS